MKKRYDVQKDSYDDILHLPHHQSKIHPHMTIHDRAAQFAPFSALTGHEAALKETARRTNDFVKLDEYEKAALDTKLQFLRKHLLSHPKIQVTWFCPDEKKMEEYTEPKHVF